MNKQEQGGDVEKFLLDVYMEKLRGQMLEIMEQIDALPGWKNRRKRKELWKKFKALTAEALVLRGWADVPEQEEQLQETVQETEIT